MFKKEFSFELSYSDISKRNSSKNKITYKKSILVSFQTFFAIVKYSRALILFAI